VNETDLPGTAWRKSTRSNGQANCVEVAMAAWRKSTRSNGQSNCVEVADGLASEDGPQRVIALRDSKDPAGPRLVFTPAGWDAFTAGVRDGEFDLS
jgi:hypothetical protein